VYKRISLKDFDDGNSRVKIITNNIQFIFSLFSNEDIAMVFLIITDLRAMIHEQILSLESVKAMKFLKLIIDFLKVIERKF
jgi:hypothetical protein